MFLLSLLACSGAEDGTWLFTLAYTQPSGDECATTVTHNFIGAYTPAVAPPDPAWSAESTQEYSPQLFFGRIDTTGDAATLIVGDQVYTGTGGAKGAWTFSWERDTATEQQYTHITGYSYTDNADDRSQITISGTVKGGTFSGSYDQETSSSDAFYESDAWSDEAAAYVGTGGLIPAASYLLKLDSAGTEVAATNTQTTYDCSSAACALTVQDGCTYSYDLTGTLTSFSPDDEGWTSSAGQPAGAP